MSTAQLDLRTHTIVQFVADFFADHAAGAIDYGDFGVCWNGYVAWVAEAGALLETAVQSRLQRGEELVEWYELLEEATEAFRGQLLAVKRQPSEAELLTAFCQIVDRHLEVAHV